MSHIVFEKGGIFRKGGVDLGNVSYIIVEKWGIFWEGVDSGSVACSDV